MVRLQMAEGQTRNKFQHIQIILSVDTTSHIQGRKREENTEYYVHIS